MDEKLRLRYWRNLRALTVRDLADLAGVNAGTITKIENHGHVPTNTVIRKLAKALEVEPKDLYGEGIDPNTLGKNLPATQFRGAGRKAAEVLTALPPLLKL